MLNYEHIKQGYIQVIYHLKLYDVLNISNETNKSSILFCFRCNGSKKYQIVLKINFEALNWMHLLQ